MKFKLRLFFCTLILLFNHDISVLSAQDTNDTTIIWRGFEHSWTYNHRINRLGNYVDFKDNEMVSCHASASGLGADSTHFTAHYSILESPSVGFHAGSTAIKLYGKEKQLLTKRIEISVPATKALKDKEQYITLLNGFDLRAVDRADKIQMLRFSIENAEYAPAINEIRFYLNVSLVVNCQSFECSRFNQHSTYDLKLYYLILAGDKKELKATPKTMTKNYPWGRKDEYYHTPEKHYVIGEKDEPFETAALGIKSMALTLNSAHWTVQYNNNVTPLSYDDKTARMDFSLDLFFKEWQQGMKNHSARPGLSKFSSKKKGWGVLDMGILLLQFRDAKITHKKHSGSLYWPGNNATSSDPDSESKRELIFPE